jgi:cytoskeletal protein CcmA (bactofilin family)
VAKKGRNMAVFKKKDEPNLTPTSASSEPDTSISGSGAPKSFIGKTIFVKGNVFSDEEVFIEGKIQGQLNIKHRVVVEKGGIVNADIEAREVIVKGTVNGNVKGNYKVEIVPDGVVNGNILSQRVVLAEGAIFKGNIDMTLKDGS